MEASYGVREGRGGEWEVRGSVGEGRGEEWEVKGKVGEG